MKFRYPASSKRRGLSSVAGAMLFVTLMASMFTLFGQAVDSSNNIVSVAKQEADKVLEKKKEKFTISVSTDPLSVLDVTVINSGPNSVEIPTLIITNSTEAATGYPTTVYEIPSDASFIAAGKNSNILSGTNVTMALNNTYEIKVISSLGTIKKDNLICGDTSCAMTGNVGLNVDIFLNPPIGIPTKNVTAVMTVTNTGDSQLTEVKPLFANPVIEFPPSSSMIGPTPDSVFPVSLGPHQSVLFKWDLKVNGFPGDVWNFTNAATGLDPTLHTVTSQNATDQLVIVNPNDCGGCDQWGENGEKLVLINDLLVRPSAFMTIPSPFGDAINLNKTGIWGVHVANPTNSTIKVPRVVITAIAPGSQDQDIMFSDADDCSPVSVGSINYPPVSDLWTCQQENVLYWQDYANPIVLDPYSAQTFLVKALPEKSGAKVGESHVQIISANVFSSAGTFGKDDYQTTMFGANDIQPGIIVNVYMSTEINGYANDKIEAMRLNIPPNSTETFNIVLADFSEHSSHSIDVGAKVIINLPRDWKFEGFNSFAGFENPPEYKIHANNATQIIGTTNVEIGNVNGTTDARTISFNATAPDVTTDSMYVMYLLANGKTKDNIAEAELGKFDPPGPIGPLSEIILHVKP